MGSLAENCNGKSSLACPPGFSFVAMLQKLGMELGTQLISSDEKAVLVLCRVKKVLEEKPEREERKDIL